MSATAKNLIPLFNRILVKRADPVTQTKGGIVLPENKKQRVMRGTVVAIGTGTYGKEKGEEPPSQIKVGDEVLLPDYGGTRLEDDNKQEYFLFREPDILAKIDGKV